MYRVINLNVNDVCLKENTGFVSQEKMFWSHMKAGKAIKHFLIHMHARTHCFTCIVHWGWGEDTVCPFITL